MHTTDHSTSSILVLVAALPALFALPAAGLSPDDLCGGDPCVITADEKVDQDEVLDFGPRTVVLSSTLDARDNDLTIRAGSFSIDPSGQLQGTGIIAIEADNDVVIGGTRSRGAVRMVGEEGGTLRISSNGGSVTGGGKIVLSSNSSEGDGGDLTIEAAGEVFLIGTIEAVGGFDGAGGGIEVDAAGNVSLTGNIDLSGGGFDGGSIDIASRGSIFLRNVNVDGGGDLGGGGDVDLAADHDITFLGPVESRGSALSDEECGDGGSVTAAAGGTLTIATTIDVSGREGDCWAGEIDLSAETIELRDALELRGDGNEGRGGDLTLVSQAELECAERIDFSGNDGGGSVEFEAAADLTIAPGCVLNGSGPGGTVDLSSNGRLLFDGYLEVGLEGASTIGFPAGLDVTACEMLIGQDAVVASIGEDAVNTFTVAGEAVFAGDVRAGLANSLIVPVQYPPVVSGSVVPPVMTELDPNLVPCGGMPPTATATPPATATVIPTEPATPTASFTPTDPPPTATAARTATPDPTQTATTPAQPTSSPTEPANTATPTLPSATATPTPTDSPPACAGDCNGDGSVSISELIRLTNIALGAAAECAAVPAGEPVGIPFLIRAVRASLEGC
jgi:hypothetical protein